MDAAFAAPALRSWLDFRRMTSISDTGVPGQRQLAGLNHREIENFVNQFQQIPAVL